MLIVLFGVVFIVIRVIVLIVFSVDLQSSYLICYLCCYFKVTAAGSLNARECLVMRNSDQRTRSAALESRIEVNGGRIWFIQIIVFAPITLIH